jgi:transcriptional regulator with XRE-family HTH domain
MFAMLVVEPEVSGGAGMAEQKMPVLARQVKALREAAGLSQQALATAAGLSISVVAQIEQGKKADPKLSTVLALAGALRVSLDALVSESGKKPRKGK